MRLYIGRRHGRLTAHISLVSALFTLLALGTKRR